MGSTCGLPTAATTRCRRSTPRAGRSWRRALRTPASRASRSVPEGCGSATRGARTSCGWTPISRRATARCEWPPRAGDFSGSSIANPVAVGEGAVWVGRGYGSLARVAPARRSSWSTTSRSATTPSPWRPGAGAVWVVDQDDGTLARIDPRSANAVTWATQVGQSPVALALGEDAVWVASSQSDTVSRVDPENGAVTAVIPVGRHPTGVATGAGAVWVANSLDGTVSRIDPETNQVAATIAVGEAPRSVTLRRRQGLGQRPERRAAESRPGLVGGGGTGPRPVRSRADRSRPRPRLHAPGGHLCPALQLSGPARPRGGPAGSRDRGRAPNGLGRWTAVRVSHPLRLSVLPAVGRARHGGLLRPGNRAHARSPDGFVWRRADGRHRGSRGVRGRPRGATSPGSRPAGIGSSSSSRARRATSPPDWRRRSSAPFPRARPWTPRASTSSRPPARTTLASHDARAKLRAAPQPELRRTAPAGTRRDPLRHRLVTGARTRRGRGGTSRLPRAGCVHGGRAVVDRRCRGAGRPPRTG